jgi:hypothetical protein
MHLITLVAACALLLFWRVPRYMTWCRSDRTADLVRIAVEGIIAGVAVAGIAMALFPTGEPGMMIGLSDRLLFLSVLAGVCMLNGLLLYAVIRTLDHQSR